jgi:hypothetical protein
MTAFTVNALFAIALIATLVKGGDLILLESQKRALQDWCERVTVRLDDLRPLAWFSLNYSRNPVVQRPRS